MTGLCRSKAHPCTLSHRPEYSEDLISPLLSAKSMFPIHLATSVGGLIVCSRPTTFPIGNNGPRSRHCCRPLPASLLAGSQRAWPLLVLCLYAGPCYSR